MVPYCQACGDRLVKHVEHSGGCSGVMLGLFLIGAGVAASIFLLPIGGPLFGVPLAICGLFCGSKSRKVLRCRSCGYTVERS